MATPTQQKLKKMHIKQLKNIVDLEVSFEGSELTAIMGVNGSGKSTVLHALACCYKPLDNDDAENYKFSQFFTPTPDSLWQGSSFNIQHEYRVGKKTYDETVEYAKNTDRWSPQYSRRPERPLVYIGISSCVPKIEAEKKNSFIGYSTTPLADDISRQIKEKAGYVMNRDYSSYNMHRSKKSEYIGVEYNTKRYSSLSMSAGEQRIFRILTEVYKAQKYSLILVDEIDLLLHAAALRRLLIVLKQRAADKSLQIIFTTHSPSLVEMNDIVNIRHLCNTPAKTLCFSETKPDAIYRLTGVSNRPLEIFVEDDLAKTIVMKVCEELGMSKYVSSRRFGAAKNCFTLVSGILLSGESVEGCLFVLDGDEYNTEEQKVAQLNTVLTGNTEEHTALRRKALAQITQFNLPKDFSPERFIHRIITTMRDDSANEIIQAALEISKVDNSHHYVDDIIHRLGYESKIVGLSKIIELASRADVWDEFIRPIKEWLKNKEEMIKEKVIAAS